MNNHEENSVENWSKVLEKIAENGVSKRQNAQEVFTQVEAEIPWDAKDIELMDLVNLINELSRVPLYSGCTVEQKLSYKTQLEEARYKLKAYNC